MTEILRQHLQNALSPTYTLERELGGGGMSRVFVATEVALGRLVVVKVITPDQSEGVSAERFAREMKMAARLQQANIVPVLSTGVADGLPYYTMPFVAGESLRARLAAGGSVPISEAVNILRDMARALAFAHAQGIVHRDIKPENILLSGGAAVVTDFGIAKAFSASRTTTSTDLGTLTRAGYAVGTPAYMAPEQVAADATVDHRADLYAWGLVAWELLAGRHPFEEAKSGQALITAQLTRMPPDVKSLRADVPPSLSRIIEQALAKEPESRPASASEIIAALDLVSTTGGGIPTRAVKVHSRRKYPVAIAGGAMLLVLAVVAWLLTRQGSGGGGPALRTLAVLPFESTGGDTANDYFAEGMAEEVATALAKVPGLQLAGRNSANAHAGKSPQDIGKLLGVGAVLQGSVRRAGERMRVSVELTNAESGIVMWTESYEREVKDVFGVQDEISREIVSALRMTLGGGDSAPTVAANRGTDNMAAYDDYLRGLYQYQRREVQDAVDAFGRAIAQDSMFARAYAGLAQSLVSLTEYADVRTEQALPRARVAAETGLRLAPALAETHLSMGLVLMFEDRWSEADPEFRRAIELDPSMAAAHQFYGRFLWATGRISEAVEQATKARELDPLNASILANMGAILIAAGRPAEGFEAARTAFEMDSTLLVAITAYANSSVAAGKLAEARDFGDRVRRSNTDVRALGAAAYALGRGGDTTSARAIYNEMVRRKGEWRSAMARVRGALGLGDTALALIALEEGLAAKEPIPINVSFINPMFDQVRGSARFDAVIRGYGLDPANFATRKP
jgi:TolB-like protein/tRNA A-37 threonylcarbamoyl transferase component Bud32